MPENEQAIILELLEGMIIKYETRRGSTRRRNQGETYVPTNR